jgi:IPT/TIG domain
MSRQLDCFSTQHPWIENYSVHQKVSGNIMSLKFLTRALLFTVIISFSTNALAFMDFTHMKPYKGAWGSKVKLFGKNFETSKVKIYFNNKLIKPLKVFKRSLTVVIPDGSRSGWFEVEQGQRRLRAPKRFIIQNETKLINLVPSAGPAAIWISAKGHFFDSKTKFYMGYVKLQSKFISHKEVKIFIPKGVKSSFFSFTSLSRKKTTRLKYKIAPFPEFLSFTPHQGWYGNKITIHGKNFCPAIKVRLGNKLVKIIKRTKSTIIVKIKKGSQSAIPQLICFGKQFKAKHKLVVKPSFGSIESVVPKAASPGKWVILNGNRFTKNDNFWLGNRKVTSKKFISNKQFKIKIPKGSTTEIFHHQSFKRIRASRVVMTIDYPPVITKFTPLVGWYGEKVTLKGKFCPNPKITLGKESIKNYKYLAKNKIMIRVPKIKSGGKITVSCRHWSVTSKKSFKLAPPTVTITAISPKEGPPGTTITISGRNFPKNMKILRKGRPLTTKVVDRTLATAVISGRKQGKFSIFAYGKYWNSKIKFKVAWPKPIPSKFFPINSWHRGVITIIGKKFCASPSVSLVDFKVKNKSKQLKVLSSRTDTIRVLLPAKAFKGHLQVKCYQHIAKLKGLVNLKPPVGNIASIHPTYGPPGTWVTINGSKFREELEFYLGNKLLPTKFISSSQIRVKIPKGYPSGKLSVKTGRTMVTTPFGFKILYSKPVIGNFSPDLAWINDIVVIKGRNFCPEAKVIFPGNVNAAVISRISHTILKVKAPKNAKSGYIKIVCPGQFGLSEGWFTMAPPYSRVHQATPSLACPGDKITIKGINFKKTTGFYIGNKRLGSKIVNQYKAFAFIPQGARSGDIRVKSFGKILNTTISIIIKSRICKNRKK